MHYKGHAFNKIFDKGKASGSLTVSSQGISFRNEQSEIMMPLGGIKLSLGGARNRILFITHPSAPEWKLYTSDRNLLKDPALSSNMHIREQLLSVKKKKYKLTLFGLLLAGVLFFGAWGAWSLKDIFVVKAADQVPPQWEQKIGAVAYEAFSSGRRIVDDEKIQQDLEKLVSPLLQVAGNENYDYNFHIVEDSTLNAAAFPGGHVIIHSGLILKVKKPEDLLGVLAHEIAHVNCRHSIRQLINTAGLYLVLSSLVGDIGAISGVVLDGGSRLLQLQNSRSHELEADERGWEYLIAAKINPRGLIDCFKIMQEEMQEMTGKIPIEVDFLSTHPALGDRIAYLEEKWQQLQNKEDFITIDVDFKQFQQMLRLYLASSPGEKDQATENEAAPSSAEKKLR